jgi:prophage tail gpP-like protein
VFDLPLIGSKPVNFYLTVAGKEFGGWLSVTVEKSLDLFAHAFSLRYADKWTIDDEPWEIFAGEECVLHWESSPIVSGYITRTEHSITGNQYDLTASGRSYTGDLVDCSAIYKRGKWRNTSLINLASTLCEPFAIAVEDEAGITRPFKRFELDEGETVHDAIDRACRIRACLPITNNDGSVSIIRSDSLDRGTFDLDYGLVESRRLMHDEQDRYNVYTFKGQSHADDEHHFYNAATKKGFVNDPTVTRYRPLIVLAETESNAEDLGERAVWERNVRAARSDQVEYTLDGITNPDGNPWEPGMRVRVLDTLLKIASTLLVNSVQFQLGADGLHTTLGLVSPETYSMLELPDRGNAWNA